MFAIWSDLAKLELPVTGIKLGFTSSSAAVKYLNRHPNIRWIKDNGDGSASYREGLRKKILELQEAFSAIERCRKPVIAAVHGHCIGGGVDLLSACDVRMASKDALFSIRETRIGIIADIGTLQRLPTIIGHGWCRELALTGRNFTAADALKMGFITHLCEDRESLYAEAKALADEIFAEWNRGELESYLIEITANVLAKHDENYMPPEAADALKKAETANVSAVAAIPASAPAAPAAK